MSAPRLRRPLAFQPQLTGRFGRSAGVLLGFERSLTADASREHSCGSAALLEVWSGHRESRSTVTHLRKKMLEELERRNYFREHCSLLSRRGAGFCTLLPASARATRTGPDSELSSAPVSRLQTRRQHREPTSGGAAVLLPQDAQAILEPEPDALPQEGATSAERPQPTAGCPTDRCRRQLVPSHAVDDAVRHT